MKTFKALKQLYKNCIVFVKKFVEILKYSRFQCQKARVIYLKIYQNYGKSQKIVKIPKELRGIVLIKLAKFAEAGWKFASDWNKAIFIAGPLAADKIKKAAMFK